MSELTLEIAEKEYASVMAHIRGLDKPVYAFEYSGRTKRPRSCVGHNWYEIVKTGIDYLICSKCNMIVSLKEQ